MGASNHPAKWGYRLARGALKGRHRRAVFLVNRDGDEILGQSSYRRLSTLPESPELVVIAVGAAGFEQAVTEALQAGARAIVGITAGLGERGADGLALERAMAQRVRDAGAILVGPNCLGVADTGSELDLAWHHFAPGPVGLVSQSGNLALELAQLAEEARVGFSRFVSLGNQSDVDGTECVQAFIEHDATRALALYLEDFRDGRAFAAAAEAAVRAGKPVVLLTVGRSQAAARAARTHTGAMVSESVAVDAACRASGALRVETPQQMIDLLQVLLMPHRPAGRRVAVVGDGGGHVAVATDRLTAHGLVLERFPDPLAARIAAVLPPTAETRNPVDLAGGGEQDVFNYERVVRLIADSGEADVVILTGYFGGYGEQSDVFGPDELRVAEAMALAANADGRPLVVHTMFPKSAPAARMREHGVPVFGDIEAACRSLGQLVKAILRPAFGMPAALPTSLPAPLPEVTGRGVSEADYFVARRLMAGAGIPFAEARSVHSIAEAHAGAAEMGYPVVIKALGRLHKSDAGGVRLANADGELAGAFQEMRALGGFDFSVERLAPVDRGVEVVIGVHRDPRFGPIALVGMGGVFTEILRDVAVALAPVSDEQAEVLIRSLRGADLLLGARSRPSLDLKAAARALSALSWLAAGRTNLCALEVNPLLVLEHGVLGLDARIEQDLPTTATSPSPSGGGSGWG